MKTTSFITLMSLCLVIGLSSFKSNSGSPIKISKPAAETVSKGVDIDVNAFMASLGMSTMVDEKQLLEQYPGVTVAMHSNTGVEIKFANPTAQQYRLDIYDLDGNILVTYVDIYGDTVKVDQRFVAAFGSYLYKLTGEGNTYAGKFSAELR